MNYAETPAKNYAKLAQSATLGAIISLFSSVILLIVFAFIINSAFGDPDGVLNIFTAIAAGIGAILGGFQASRKNGSNGLLAGLITGSGASAIILVVMLCAGTTGANGLSFKIILILCEILCSGLGGIFAVNSGGRNAHRRR